MGFAVTFAVAAVGAGPLLITMAPYMMPVGMALYGYNALKRMQRASAQDLPQGLAVVGTYFCGSRCHTILRNSGRSAMRPLSASSTYSRATM